jgi:predicted RNA-binding Zn ribbon-like protein
VLRSGGRLSQSVCGGGRTDYQGSAPTDRSDGFKTPARDNASGLEFRTMRRWRSPEGLLLPVGEALAKFVCEEDFSNVKACEGPACTLMFADHTRGHARRWCSMAICGNRAKQAAHRSRLKMQQ